MGIFSSLAALPLIPVGLQPPSLLGLSDCAGESIGRRVSSEHKKTARIGRHGAGLSGLVRHKYMGD